MKTVKELTNFLISKYEDKLMAFNDYWKITYVREKWGRFEGNCGGAQFLKALAEPG